MVINQLGVAWVLTLAPFPFFFFPSSHLLSLLGCKDTHIYILTGLSLLSFTTFSVCFQQAGQTYYFFPKSLFLSFLLPASLISQAHRLTASIIWLLPSLALYPVSPQLPNPIGSPSTVFSHPPASLSSLPAPGSCPRPPLPRLVTGFP